MTKTENVTRTAGFNVEFISFPKLWCVKHKSNVSLRLANQALQPEGEGGSRCIDPRALDFGTS